MQLIAFGQEHRQPATTARVRQKATAAAIEFYNKQFYALSTLEFAFVVATNEAAALKCPECVIDFASGQRHFSTFFSIYRYLPLADFHRTLRQGPGFPRTL